MQYEREIYIRDGLLLPLAKLGVCVIVLIVNCVNMLSEYPAITSVTVWMTIFALCFNLFVICRLVPSALKHTIYLFREGDWDVIMMQGELQEIKLLDHSPHYSMPRGKVANAVLLYVNGEELYCMSAEGLTIGKEMIVRYLPKSKIVLSWRNAYEEESPF
ncbi:MAG: hypothetical protein IKX20_10070 [Paludibacteraceae bacterium]|nr:hypothetical protein [Paludibacteraceae bacterium]